MAIETTPWDAADHLETKEDIAAYLEAALEDGDPELVAAALMDIARAKGMIEIAQETGVEKESIVEGLSADNGASFVTVLKIFQALGLRISATTA